MRSFLSILLALSCFACNQSEKSGSPEGESHSAPTDSIVDFREFRVTDSKYINNTELWADLSGELDNFTEDRYNTLKPLILEQNIPTLQKLVNDRKLSYEELTKFYLYRIRLYDRENSLSLNSVIALNKDVVEQARQKDRELLNKKLKHPIFGMPILLKDNVNASGMATTAGAVALQHNMAADAFIVERLKSNGALILGKANLSEWAYYFCEICPSGYSAIGGQTFNPYGRRMISTGGSSSGSGVATAANLCVAAVGTETSGSILSPSGSNSLVGLKPTIGLLSRTGIVPISSTLDTPGPMTRTVIDNAILLEAMSGYDRADPKSIEDVPVNGYALDEESKSSLSGKRFGAIRELMADSIYVRALSQLVELGADVIEFDAEELALEDLDRLLNLDMINDLPAYISATADSTLEVRSVQDIIEFNRTDSINIMPYGQRLFDSIVADHATEAEFKKIKTSLKTKGRRFYDAPMAAHDLDAILSLNNTGARYAAVAEYPAITVPMGYDAKGKPQGLTFIAKPLQEHLLLQWAYAFEQGTKVRRPPASYD